MPMVGPRITNGLGAWGIQVTFELNPFYADVVVQDAIAVVKVIVIADGVVKLVDLVGVIHVNDEDSFHKDEVGGEGPQHAASGLDPVANPPFIFTPDEDSYHTDEAGEEGPQHAESGLDPAANPPSVWKPDGEGSDGTE